MSWFRSSIKPPEQLLASRLLGERVVFEAEWIVAGYEATEGES